MDLYRTYQTHIGHCNEMSISKKNIKETKKTASRDFEKLLFMELIEKVGITGKGTYYVLKGSKRGQRSHEWGHKGDKRIKL